MHPSPSPHHTGLSKMIELTASGPRAPVTLEQADEHLAAWAAQIAAFPPGTPVTCVRLSCRCWSPTAYRRLKPFLESIASTVTHLIVDDIIASLDTELGLETLELIAETFANSPLKVWNLDDNAIGSRGVEKLEPIFRIDSLVHFSFANLGLSLEVCQLLLRWLRQHAHKIEHVSLGRNQMGPEGAEQIGLLLPHCDRLRNFGYGGARPRLEGTRFLCGGLAQLAEGKEELVLERLDLNDCSFGTGQEEDDPIHSLCRVLEKCPHLVELLMESGSCEQDGLEMLTNALLISGAKLLYLDFGAFEFGPDAVESLLELLREQPNLIELKLSVNEMGDEGVKKLVQFLVETKACPKLEVLNLDQNDIEEDGFQFLAENRIESLQVLSIVDNNEEDIDEGILETLRALYPTVLITDEDRHEATNADVAAAPPAAAAQEQADQAVDDLADAFANM